VQLSSDSGATTTPPTATLVIGTHEASEADLAATVLALESSDVVSKVTSVLRVEGS
jgi:homoserine dehydrogenase